MINIINYQFLPVSRFFVPNRNKQPFVIVFFQKLTAETYIHSYSLTSQHHVISNLSISIIHAFQKKKVNEKWSPTCRDKSYYPNTCTCWGWNNKTWQWEQWEKSRIYWLTIADYSRGGGGLLIIQRSDR